MSSFMQRLWSTFPHLQMGLAVCKNKRHPKKNYTLKLLVLVIAYQSLTPIKIQKEKSTPNEFIKFLRGETRKIQLFDVSLDLF